MRTAVWAYKRLDALDGKIGVVHCDSILAKGLLESGDVQDLRQGRSLRRLDAAYQTKVMIPSPSPSIAGPDASPEAAAPVPKVSKPKKAPK